MIPAKQLLKEIVSSLREVIAPAIAEPYPRSQAYMAAVILEFVSRQIEERHDIEEARQEAIHGLFDDLSRVPGIGALLGGLEQNEVGASKLIEQLYDRRDALGEEQFTAASRRVRQTLRQLLDQDLKVAGKVEG